jgi:hypothetical protein
VFHRRAIALPVWARRPTVRLVSGRSLLMMWDDVTEAQRIEAELEAEDREIE